jgi:cytochrome o ubiquinol oxidase subunit 3
MGLGMSFLALEIHEFHHLASIGDSWHRSGSLSAYFTLVGTHGLHITVGLLWLVVLLFYTRKRGLTAAMTRKLRLFSIFWHFLDVIWIFIFSIVYLFGVLQP